MSITEPKYETNSEYVDIHKYLLNGEKPTIDQVAWVFAHLNDHLDELGSFRYLVYDRMGYDEEAYIPLFSAGGMAITNAFYELKTIKNNM